MCADQDKVRTLKITADSADISMYDTLIDANARCHRTRTITTKHKWTGYLLTAPVPQEVQDQAQDIREMNGAYWHLSSISLTELDMLKIPISSDQIQTFVLSLCPFQYKIIQWWEYENHDHQCRTRTPSEIYSNLVIDTGICSHNKAHIYSRKTTLSSTGLGHPSYVESSPHNHIIHLSPI